MYNLIKYSMQWYCQNLLITFSGHISVGFTDSCEDWNVSAVAATDAQPHHAMDLTRKNNYSRQVHSIAKVLDIVFPLIRDKRCIVFLFNNVYAIYLLLNPKWQDCFLSMWDWFRNTNTELNLQHAYIRFSPLFLPENANKYWFVSHWHTQVLQFILERLVT